jgi:hypothetical protein
MPAHRFEPLPLPAGASRRRLEVFSPKLGRRLSLTSYEQWKCWLIIEANPAITSYCERPMRVAGAGSAMVDFWVELRDQVGGEFWLFDGGEAATSGDRRPGVLRGLRVRVISPTLLGSFEVPLSNWAQILPYLISYRNDRDPLLEQSLVVELRAWTSLGDLLDRFRDHDRDAVQAALFWLVATGRVESADLATATLTRETRFRRR